MGYRRAGRYGGQNVRRPTEKYPTITATAIASMADAPIVDQSARGFHAFRALMSPARSRMDLHRLHAAKMREESEFRSYPSTVLRPACSASSLWL